jgi:hypothetical protein
VRAPWRRAAAWLLFLGPFFFATYGLATWLTTQRAHVGSIVFGWEHAVPFVPWTIVPYWAIDALYGISLFVCADKSELDTHARRLLTAQLVAIASFLLFPLRFTFARPDTDGALRRPVHSAVDVRPAVQPGAVAAHRAARYPVGAVRTQAPWREARAGRRRFRLDRHFGHDDVAASLHRRAHGCAARLLLSLAVAAGRAHAACDRTVDPRPAASGTRRALFRRSAGIGGSGTLLSVASPCGCRGSSWR